jgi:DNA-directed RNA polymerase specialized sigma subunit
MAYINKEHVIEFITNGLNNPDKAKAYGYDAIEILAEIEHMPTAEVEEVRHGKRIEQLCDDMTLKFIVLMVRSGKTDFPEFKKLKQTIKKLPLKERVIAQDHYLSGKKIQEIVNLYGYSERHVYRLLTSAKKLMRGSEINVRA